MRRLWKIIVSSDELHHGNPQASRNDKWGFDKYLWPPSPIWPRGLEVHVYDHGRVKVGGWQTSVSVLDVSNFSRGASNASGHVIAQFQPAPEGGQRIEATATEDLDPPGQGGNFSTVPAQTADDEEADEGSLSDEDAYERATWEAIEECKHLTPRYDPSVWIGMVRQWGAAEAARHLLVSGDIQYGFRRLIASGRHDLTVEWSVLQPRWIRLFSVSHREAAAWRLRQAGIQPPRT